MTHTVILIFYYIILLVIGTTVTLDIDLPDLHLPYFFNSHPKFQPQGDFQQNSTAKGRCWGYEDTCNPLLRFGKDSIYCKNERFQQMFWKNIDFGYVRSVQKEMFTICQTNQPSGSYLKCSRNARYCVGRNIYFNFHRLSESTTNKYREDLFSPGDVGGLCELNATLLQQQGDHKSPLQSWFAELEHFTQLDFSPATESRERCDVTLDSAPVVMVKLDFGGNMFHHFCDFFNLYASQHVNGSWFSRDVIVVMWDTATPNYFDPFRSSWKVFTSRNSTLPLTAWAGKRVCVRDVMFPLLPRMRHGLYYNTYVPPGCVGSNLFRAFSQHFLHRMRIRQRRSPASSDPVRVTFLQRGNPERTGVYRQVTNQEELVAVLREFADFRVQVVEFDWRKMSFEEQLNITHNSDIMIGMHGAGLTHFLFLPDWAVAFELYNCGDENCYRDLARSRGVDYMTWSGLEPGASERGRHPRYGDNPKFWNWRFDAARFRELMTEARRRVLVNMRRHDNAAAAAAAAARDEL